MKFTISGSRIICSRKDTTRSANDPYKRVVEFDAQVDKVPPHVAARLTRREIDELEAFMADRRRIQANPADKNMLEALPELLEEATDILDSVDQVNVEMYDRLTASLAALRSALDDVRPADDERLTSLTSMHGCEAQKERLENIKQDM